MSLPRAFTAFSGATAVSMVAQLIRGKFAALFLGPAGVGIFNQLALTWNLFQLAGQLGSFNGIVQHGADALADDNQPQLLRLVSTSTLLLGGVSCMLALAGAIAAAPVSDVVLHDGGRHAALVRLLMLAVPFAVTAQTYRALLSAARAVPQLVRNQIISDVGSAIVFGVLVAPFGLGGAILGFMTAHLILFVAGLLSARRVLGQALMPRWTYFRWSIVRSNVGFGASGLVMFATTNVSVLLVSRILIARFGLEANGIFSNAWRIASVYLGAITATTISYLVPTFTRARDSSDMSRDLNSALAFFLALLPPVMTGIMATGELIVPIVLSAKFSPVAPLLLLFVPAELFRVLAETMTIPLLARRKMVPFTLLYLAQASIFVACAALLIPSFGMVGAAVAYGVSTVSGAVIDGGAAFIITRARIRRDTWMLGSSAVVLLASVASLCHWLPLGLSRFALSTLLLGLWFAVNTRSVEFMSLLRGGFRSMTKLVM